jgi:hypothetical protein
MKREIGNWIIFSARFPEVPVATAAFKSKVGCVRCSSAFGGRGYSFMVI